MLDKQRYSIYWLFIVRTFRDGIDLLLVLRRRARRRTTSRSRAHRDSSDLTILGGQRILCSSEFLQSLRKSFVPRFLLYTHSSSIFSCKSCQSTWPQIPI